MPLVIIEKIENNLQGRIESVAVVEAWLNIRMAAKLSQNHDAQ